MERFIGCGARYEPLDGPVHGYLQSSPACFAAFCRLLAAEYESAVLMDVHRLTVDTWAIQHPGPDDDPRAVRSRGLHLARLHVEFETSRPSREINAAMLEFMRSKMTLRRLDPPKAYRITVDEVAPHAGTPSHAAKVRAWAQAAWEDWSDHHAYIRDWVNARSGYGSG
ncbi:DUF5946 family protein [Jannaschia sp. KMU-145]|uniref:DUF5946 family protein n=1 Tax=Jannaschia halovivens TaxID=3388667 RepID=UPI00396B0672